MLKVYREDGLYRVELFQVNRLNTLFTDLVKKQLTELLEECGTRVMFDLDGVRFIDSAGFQVLADVTNFAKSCGSEFMICNVTEEVHELIILLEMEGELAFCECKKPKEKILLVLD